MFSWLTDNWLDTLCSYAYWLNPLADENRIEDPLLWNFMLCRLHLMDILTDVYDMFCGVVFTLRRTKISLWLTVSNYHFLVTLSYGILFSYVAVGWKVLEIGFSLKFCPNQWFRHHHYRVAIVFTLKSTGFRMKILMSKVQPWYYCLWLQMESLKMRIILFHFIMKMHMVNFSQDAVITKFSSS